MITLENPNPQDGQSLEASSLPQELKGIVELLTRLGGHLDNSSVELFDTTLRCSPQTRNTEAGSISLMR